MPRAEMKSDAIAWAPRGLSREMAARYIGVGTTKFDELVTRHLMPKPKKIDSRKVWDRHAIDVAFSDLPDDGASNPWDRTLSKRAPVL